MSDSQLPTKEEVWEFLKSKYPLIESISDILNRMRRVSTSSQAKECLLVIEQNADWFVDKLREFAVPFLKRRAERDDSPFRVSSHVTIKSKEEPRKSSASMLVSEKHSKVANGYWAIERVYQIPHDKSQLDTYEGWMRLKNRVTRMNIPSKSSELLYIPNYNRNVLLSNTRRHLAKIDFFEKAEKLGLEVSRFEFLAGYLFDDLYSSLKQETSKYLLPLFQEKDLDLHDDIVYPFEVIKPFLTPVTAKAFCKMSSDEKREWVNGLSAYKSHNKELMKSLRRKISLCLRKGVSLEDTCKELERLTEQFTIKLYKLSHEQLEHITTHYLPVLKRYKNNASVAQFLSVFGKQGTRKILNGPPCIFSPTEYRLPSLEKTALASLVSERLGSLEDDYNLKARKRLYSRLNKIAPVEDIQNGNFSNELIPAIKKELNLSPNKTLSLSQKFTAKIEKKASPEFLVAGDASVCCMSMGTEKATTYALEKGFGVFNVYFDGRIIANSVLWVNNEDTLVIDNIEVHPNYQKHTEYIKEMYHQLIKDMSKTYPNIVQGDTYNDLELFPDSDYPYAMKVWNPIDINGHFYSDAQLCHLLKGDKSIFKESTIYDFPYIEPRAFWT